MLEFQLIIFTQNKNGNTTHLKGDVAVKINTMHNNVKFCFKMFCI